MPAAAEQPPETESGSLFSTPSWPQLGVGTAVVHPGRTLKQWTGWWYTYPFEKYDLVSWGYYSQDMEKSKSLVGWF